MSVFVDTSALLAVLDAGDAQHPHARAAWETLLQQDEPLLTTSYVLVETFALVQNRLGMDAVRVLADDVVPVLRVHWVGEPQHRLGVTALVAAGRRQLSLVDCVSFATPPSPSTGTSRTRAFARSPEPGLRRLHPAVIPPRAASCGDRAGPRGAPVAPPADRARHGTR